jgi:mycothiol synthase
MNSKTSHRPLPTIRNYRSSDFERFRKLKFELEKRATSLDLWSLQELEESLALSNRVSESNAFVAEMGENLIAFLKLDPELDIGRVVLALFVQSGHWTRRVLLNLIQEAVIRARELEARKVHINVRRGCLELKNVLLETGFRSIRRYQELRLDLSRVSLTEPPRKTPHIRHFKRGEEDRLANIQNRAFRDTWGYSANTLQDIIDRTALPSFSPQNVLFAFNGENIAGYCWTMMAPTKRFPFGGPGRIYMIGVDPEYRRSNIGKQLLLAGLSYLKAKGTGVVDLTVDSKNNPARTLYKSVGFRPRTSTLWYEKSVREWAPSLSHKPV